MKWTNKSYLEKQLRRQRWEYRKKEWRKHQRDQSARANKPGTNPTQENKYQIRKYEKPAKSEGYIPSKGGNLKCKKHPDPEYHEQIKELYRTTSKLYRDKKS